VSYDGLEQSVKMVIPRVIKLPKGLESAIQIAGQGGRVIVAQAGVVQTVLVSFVKREEGDLLRGVSKRSIAEIPDML
jgi:hypothetical protein